MFVWSWTSQNKEPGRDCRSRSSGKSFEREKSEVGLEPDKGWSRKVRSWFGAGQSFEPEKSKVGLEPDKGWSRKLELTSY